MKKLFAVILAALMLLSLAACSGTKSDGTAPATTAPEKDVLVGFGEGNITYMDGPIGLTGYGNEATRLSTGIKSEIFIHCVAITDTDGETVLIMSIDAGAGSYESTIRPLIKQKFDIPEDHVLVSAIHQHSTPTGGQYMPVIREGAEEAVRQALEDQAPAKMFIGTTETTALSFVRNYVCNDGSFYGPNYGSAASGIAGHESDADPEMRIIKFDRGEEKKPIIMVNFQAHPPYGRKQQRYQSACRLARHHAGYPGRRVGLPCHVHLRCKRQSE